MSQSSITLSPSLPSSRNARLAYKLNEAAEMLGVKPLTIRRLIERGQLRACRQLRHVLIPKSELDRFLAS